MRAGSHVGACGTADGPRARDDVAGGRTEVVAREMFSVVASRNVVAVPWEASSYRIIPTFALLRVPGGRR